MDGRVDARVTVRKARPDEYAEAGRVTADAYRPFADEGDQYLSLIADVAGRAA